MFYFCCRLRFSFEMLPVKFIVCLKYLKVLICFSKIISPSKSACFSGLCNINLLLNTAWDVAFSHRTYFLSMGNQLSIAYPLGLIFRSVLHYTKQKKYDVN